MGPARRRRRRARLRWRAPDGAAAAGRRRSAPRRGSSRRRAVGPGGGPSRRLERDPLEVVTHRAEPRCQRDRVQRRTRRPGRPRAGARAMDQHGVDLLREVERLRRLDQQRTRLRALDDAAELERGHVVLQRQAEAGHPGGEDALALGARRARAPSQPRPRPRSSSRARQPSRWWCPARARPARSRPAGRPRSRCDPRTT